MAARTAPVVVIEAIKLLEAGLSRALCDQVWVTPARVAQQIARLGAGRGMPLARCAAALPRRCRATEMAAQADRVIDTGGTMAETALQVLAAWVEAGPAAAGAGVVRAGSPADAEASRPC